MSKMIKYQYIEPCTTKTSCHPVFEIKCSSFTSKSVNNHNLQNGKTKLGT